MSDDRCSVEQILIKLRETPIQGPTLVGVESFPKRWYWVHPGGVGRRLSDVEVRAFRGAAELGYVQELEARVQLASGAQMVQPTCTFVPSRVGPPEDPPLIMLPLSPAQIAALQKLRIIDPISQTWRSVRLEALDLMLKELTALQQYGLIILNGESLLHPKFRDTASLTDEGSRILRKIESREEIDLSLELDENQDK